jgi:hypothetical protein
MEECNQKRISTFGHTQNIVDLGYFSSQGVRYGIVAWPSYLPGLPRTWRHDVDLLGVDNTAGVRRFVVLPRIVVGRFAANDSHPP